MFFTPEIVISLLIDTLSLLLLAIAFVVAVRILLWFDYGSDTPRQYALERQSYLASTIVSFVLAVKISAIFYFIYTLDRLSLVIPGAMCAAGVVTANEYGVWLFMLKISNIYLFGLWLVLHIADLHTSNYHYTRAKFAFFLLIFILMLLEFVLELLYFGHLNISQVVSCCGTLFNRAAHSPLALVAAIDPKVIAGAFYALYAALLVAALAKKEWLFSLLSLLFLPVATIALIFFFSPYIYELPTHHCPFCILQPEYHYIGYLLYALLFIGTFLGIASAFWPKWMRKPLNLWIPFGFDTLFVGIVSFYVLYYYYQNHVWLL